MTVSTIFIIAALCVGAIFFLFHSMVLKPTRSTERLLSEAASENGLKVEFVHVLRDTGIGIDPKARKIVLVTGRAVDVFTSDQIKFMQIEWKRVGKIVEYCLILTVNDFNYPIWQVRQINTDDALKDAMGKIQFLWDNA